MPGPEKTVGLPDPYVSYYLYNILMLSTIYKNVKSNLNLEPSGAGNRARGCMFWQIVVY